MLSERNTLDREVEAQVIGRASQRESARVSAQQLERSKER
jgi:hypothetical protein